LPPSIRLALLTRTGYAVGVFARRILSLFAAPLTLCIHWSPLPGHWVPNSLIAIAFIVLNAPQLIEKHLIIVKCALALLFLSRLQFSSRHFENSVRRRARVAVPLRVMLARRVISYI